MTLLTPEENLIAQKRYGKKLKKSGLKIARCPIPIKDSDRHKKYCQGLVKAFKKEQDNG